MNKSKVKKESKEKTINSNFYKERGVVTCCRRASCADPEGVDRGSTPLENYKNIGFLRNTGPDPLNKITKSMLGHHRPASETPFKCDICGIWILPPLIKLKTKIKMDPL